MNRTIVHALTALVMTLAACAAPTEAAGPDQTEREGPASRENSGEAVGSTTQAIGLPEVYLHTVIPFGGTAVEENRFDTIGDACKPGYTRTDPPTVTSLANGNCFFDGWINPSNAHDCTARIRLHSSAAFMRGNCEVTIFEERNPATCRGHDSNGVPFCGGAGSDGSCFCDHLCQDYGDCCVDFVSACRP
jgi:hypothetical protein